MKNNILFVFVFATTFSFSQSNFKINLLNNIDYSFSEYSYNDGRVDEEISLKESIGKSVSLELEYPISTNLSVVAGIRYSHKIIRPGLLMRASYIGTKMPVGDEEVTVYHAHLRKHEFKMITLPISFKRDLIRKNKFTLYTSMGALINIKLKEIETYQTSSEWDIVRLNEKGIENNFVFSENEFSLFSTAIEVGFGMNCKLSQKLNLIVQANTSLLEFRKSNEMFNKNIEKLWEDAFLPLGQASFGIGLQREF